MENNKTVIFYISAAGCVFLLFFLWYFTSEGRYEDYNTEREAVLYSAEEAEAAEVININTAGSEELSSLPYIGEKIAERIIAYREENGGFASPEEIMNVKGIGENIYNDIKDNITVG
ncbi:MAG: helix-hairpin-helix domain-containing protein [Clostridiales bacterium]|nr:helix-hairpin-helix domain-containing protein [Clostridiales bacterium]